MPAHMSLGVSLLRRARDIVVGAPALLSWQVTEARRLREGSVMGDEDEARDPGRASLNPRAGGAAPPRGRDGN